MEFEPQDQDIVSLLTKLKSAGEQYPERMFVARRHMYLKRMAEIGMGIPAEVGMRDAPTNPNPVPVAPASSTLLETALVFAIILEASAVAYFYRDKLADFFQTITTEPIVQEVSPLPIVATAVEIQGVTPSPVITSTMPSATLAPSASATGIAATPPGNLLPGVADDNNTGSEPGSTNAATSPVVSDSTPVPSGNNNEDQGNHYGQTPKPERTKENSGNNDKPPKENNDSSSQDNGSAPPEENDDAPPGNKDNKPPKDEPKPTKTK